PLPCTFLFRCYSAHAALHSLPTRRSSDLPPGDGSTGQRVRWRAVLAADSEAHPQDGGRGDQSLRVQMIVGITRVRNESLILADTLHHYLQHCDRILLYDDCSTDATAQIAESFDRVTVIRGDEWREDRRAEETRHRGLLLEMA